MQREREIEGNREGNREIERDIEGDRGIEGYRGRYREI